MAVLVIDLIIAALAISLHLILRGPKRRYPPGLKRLPLLGNLLEIPRAARHKTFAQWSKMIDSDIIFLDAAGTPFIILNSLKATTDLLERRSAIYSSRFHLTMTYELMDCRRFIAMMPYGAEWRESRRIISKYLSPPDKHSLACARDFVRKSLLPNLLNTPKDFLKHTETGVGGSIISLTYGLRIRRVDDPWIALADRALECIENAGVPGKYAVDVLHFLKHVPEWVPGAKFQRDAREGRGVINDFFSRPFETTKKNMAEGITGPCFISDALEEVGRDGDKRYKEKMVENVAGMLFAGGTDTSVTAVKVLIAVLLLHPEIQEKAQAEIDSVIGPHRLPDYDDKPNLPYLRAILKEVLRWEPVAPLGLPHMLTEDDAYRGYFIPKGSIVIGNSWAILHNEEFFPDPSRFDPTRFLTPSGQLRTDSDFLYPEVVASFGYGCRICPGMEFGLSSFWITAASILTCFTVSSALDEMGREEVPKVEFLGKGIISHPEPFKCRIVPRSEGAVALIRADYDESSVYI